MNDWGFTNKVPAEVVLAEGIVLRGDLHLFARPAYPPGPETPLDPLTPWEGARLRLFGERLDCAGRAVEGGVAVSLTRPGGSLAHGCANDGASSTRKSRSST